MGRPRGRRVAAAAALVLLAGGAALGSFVLTRESEERPPTPTTTTTFPRDSYVDAITASLLTRVSTPLGEAGSRCIGDALLRVLGDDALHAIAEQPDPAGALTGHQRDQVLRIVVTCLDPPVAEALLGGGAPSTQAPISLPDEGG